MSVICRLADVVALPPVPYAMVVGEVEANKCSELASMMMQLTTRWVVPLLGQEEVPAKVFERCVKPASVGSVINKVFIVDAADGGLICVTRKLHPSVNLAKP